MKITVPDILRAELHPLRVFVNGEPVAGCFAFDIAESVAFGYGERPQIDESGESLVEHKHLGDVTVRTGTGRDITCEIEGLVLGRKTTC